MAPDLLTIPQQHRAARRRRRVAVALMAVLTAVLVRTEAVTPARAVVNAAGCAFVNNLQLTITPGISFNPLLQSPTVTITGSGTCADLALLDTIHFNLSVSGTLSCLGGVGSGLGSVTFDNTGSPPPLSLFYVAGPGTLHFTLVALTTDVVVGEANLVWWPFDTIACIEGQTVTMVPASGDLTLAEA